MKMHRWGMDQRSCRQTDGKMDGWVCVDGWNGTGRTVLEYFLASSLLLLFRLKLNIYVRISNGSYQSENNTNTMYVVIVIHFFYIRNKLCWCIFCVWKIYNV